MSILDGLRSGVTLQDVLQATYGDMSAEFQNRIEATFDEESLPQFGNALVEYKPGMNEFLYSLINRIGMVNVNYQSFKSPLSVFKKGFMEYGDTIEDIYIEPVQGLLYEAEVPNTNPGDQWKTFKPKMDVIYHTVNRELVYPLTINEKMLKRAFVSYRELDKFLSGLMLQLSNADEIDDFGLTLKLLSDVDNVNGRSWYYNVPVSAVVDESTAKQLVIGVRSIAPTLRFPARKFNAKGVLNWATPDDMYLLVTPQLNAVLDVEVLAKAFNMDKATFMGHIIEVPDFGTMQDTVALFVHREFLQIWDTMRQMTTTGLNALHLTTNYFYHHQGILSASPFYPAIKFTTNANSDVASIVINGPSSIAIGETKHYDAFVNGGATQTVIWSIVGAPQYSAINQNGNLSIGPNFVGSTVTIKAQAVESDVYSTLQVTVGNVEIPTFTVEEPDSSQYGVAIASLQENIKIESNAITGTLKYYDGSGEEWAAAWGADDKAGNFLAVHVDLEDGATGTIQVLGSGRNAVALDETGDAVGKITSNAEIIQITATKNGITTVKNYGLAGLTLESAA